MKYRHGKAKSKRIARFLKAHHAGEPQIYGYRFIKAFEAIKRGKA